jgi:hypothetical protein
MRVGTAWLVALVATMVPLRVQTAAWATARPPGAHRVAAGSATVPSGWVPFSYGNIQMAVRPSWNVFYEESAPFSCPLGMQGPVTLIYTSPSPGNPPVPTCAPRRSGTTVLVWYPASLRGANHLKHGALNGISTDGRVVGNWTELSLPTLSYVIYADGPQAQAVLHTLSYSVRAALASLGSAPPVPADWRHLSTDGLEFAVPPTWPVKRLTSMLSRYDIDGPQWELPRSVVIYSGGSPSPRGYFGGYGGTASGIVCLYTPKNCSSEFDQDGVVLSSPPLTPIGTQAPIAPKLTTCAPLRTLSVCLSPGDNTLFGPALYTIKRLESRGTVTLTLGLGGNGSVAETVLGSFRVS